MGGTCSMAPRKAASASSTAAACNPATERSATICPVTSSVSVSIPKRTTASYALSASSRNARTLVPSPMQMGKHTAGKGIQRAAMADLLRPTA